MPEPINLDAVKSSIVEALTLPTGTVPVAVHDPNVRVRHASTGLGVFPFSFDADEDSHDDVIVPLANEILGAVKNGLLNVAFDIDDMAASRKADGSTVVKGAMYYGPVEGQ